MKEIKRIDYKYLENTVKDYRKYFVYDVVDSCTKYAPPHCLIDILQTFKLFKSVARGDIDIELIMDFPVIEKKKIKMKFTLVNDDYNE